MVELVVFTDAADSVLDALDLLDCEVHRAALSVAEIGRAPQADLFIVDGRTALSAAKSLCGAITASGLPTPVLLVLTEGGLPTVNASWGIADVIVAKAGPSEVDARIRLATERGAPATDTESSVIHFDGLAIDEASYSVHVNGRPIALTYKEFELLRFLAGHPSRVFTREQLLSEVWGYDYFGGTRTVDVHVRRLRAKLGELDSLIGTVRNVGYRFAPVEEQGRRGTRSGGRRKREHATSGAPEEHSDDPAAADPPR